MSTRKYLLAWIAVALAIVGGSVFVATQSGTQRVPSPIPVPQLSQHPCLPGDWYMQCVTLQPNTLSISPGSPPGPPAVGAVFGLDFAWGGPSGSFAAAHGARFACSYLSNSSKDWRFSLLHSYANAGAHACFVWETSQYRALAGWSAGFSDARAASNELIGLGAAGASVFFAYDFDTFGRSCTSVCPYLRGADAAIGKARVGVYGGLRTVGIAFGAGVVSKAWQTLAWSGGVWDSRACVRQTSINNTWFGYSVDHDYLVCANSGIWPTPKPPPPKLVCFGPHAQLFNATCKRIRPLVAKWSRARDASHRAYLKTQQGLAANHCRKPYRRDVCVDLGQEIGPRLLQRQHYFDARVQWALKTY